MEKLKVSHFYDLAELPEDKWDEVFSGFAAGGAEHLTINSALLNLILREPQKVETLRRCGEKNNISFCDIHGLCGREYDLNVRGNERRKKYADTTQKSV